MRRGPGLFPGQRFWQTRSLAGTNCRSAAYRRHGVNQAVVARDGERARPLATALIHDRLVLVASRFAVCSRQGPGCLPDRRSSTRRKNPRTGADLQRLGPGICPEHGPADVFADLAGDSGRRIGPIQDVVGSRVAALSPPGRAFTA